MCWLSMESQILTEIMLPLNRRKIVSKDRNREYMLLSDVREMELCVHLLIYAEKNKAV